LIRVKRLNGKEYVLNAELIETMEATPDTVISLASGKKYVVQEDICEVVRRVKDYYRNIRCHSVDCRVDGYQACT